MDNKTLSPVRYNLSNLYLYGIPNEKCKPNSNAAFELSYNQEEFVISKLREKYPQYEWIHNGSEDTLKNLTEGDIIVKYNNKIVAHIDVKVAGIHESENLLGTIDVNSILNFSVKSNTWYLCINRNGSKYEFINGDYAFNIFNQPRCLYKTTREDRDMYLDKEIQQYANKIIKCAKNPLANKIEWINCISDNVSKYDFVPTFKMFPRYIK